MVHNPGLPKRLRCWNMKGVILATCKDCRALGMQDEDMSAAGGNGYYLGNDGHRNGNSQLLLRSKDQLLGDVRVHRSD